MATESYLVITVTAPASVEEVTFRCHVANTPAGAQRIRSGLQAIRAKYGVIRIAGSGGIAHPRGPEMGASETSGGGA
jgi:hypothetical protein